jgi:hypothetical protein
MDSDLALSTDVTDKGEEPDVLIYFSLLESGSGTGQEL